MTLVAQGLIRAPTVVDASRLGVNTVSYLSPSLTHSFISKINTRPSLESSVFFKLQDATHIRTQYSYSQPS